MNLPDIFHPAMIVLALAIFFAFFSAQQRQRRRMMTMKFFGDSLYGIYMIIMGGLAGGLASFIAASGSLTQAVTPDHKMEQTMKLRIGMAIVFSIAAIAVSVQNLNDLLPIIAVIYCRFTELQKNPQSVRIGFFFSVFPWMSYNYTNGFYWLMLYNILIGTSLMIAIIRHRKPVTPEDPV